MSVRYEIYDNDKNYRWGFSQAENQSDDEYKSKAVLYRDLEPSGNEHEVFDKYDLHFKLTELRAQRILELREAVNQMRRLEKSGEYGQVAQFGYKHDNDPHIIYAEESYWHLPGFLCINLSILWI